MSSRTLRSWNPWAGLGGLPRGVWVLAGASLVNRMGTMALPFLVLYLTHALGFSPGRAGLVLTFYGAGSIVASPFAGRLCDRFGAARVMRASMFATAAVLAVFPLAKSWWVVLLATMVFSLVNEAYRPASLSVLTELAPPGRRKAVFAVSRLSVNLGMSIGPAIGGFLAQWYFASIFWVDAATSLAAAALLAAVPLTGGGAEPDAADPSPTSAVPAVKTVSGPAWRDGALRSFLLISLLTAVVFFQQMGALAIYMNRHLGLPVSAYGLLFTINTILIVLVEVRINLLTALWPHGRALALGALFLGTGFGALAFCRSGWSVAATVVVWTLGEMILLPGMANYVAEIAPAERRGEYMGLYTASWGIAFMLAPWAGTEILARFGGGAVWGGAFAVAAIAAILLARLPAHHPAPAS